MTEAAVQPFAVEGYRGEVSDRVQPCNLPAAVLELSRPLATSETLHWGRNYLYGGWLETAGGRAEVVVKQFRNQGVRRRLEKHLKGSKAERSWRGAWALVKAGVDTAEPILWIESERPDGPSLFITRRLRDCVEARYYFRALEAGRQEQEYPELQPAAVVRAIGQSIRRMHEAGIWHRDLSIGNVLLRVGEGDDALDVFIIDLNRMRQKSRLTTWQRTRDLSRLRIFQPEHQRQFLTAYWGGAGSELRGKALLYRIAFRGFLARIAVKNALRAPFRRLRDWVVPRHAHAHIPLAPSGSSSRDRMVWDGLSDQPHQHASRLQRLGVRLSDAPLHAREWTTALVALPRIRRRYAELKSQLYRQPRPWGGMGIAVRPRPEDPETLLRAIEDVGARHILLRLHPWQEDHRHEEQLAAALHERGLDLTFVLAQNRELVRDSRRWYEAVGELAERFGRFGRNFQVGQAINRSKWGIWNHREYLDLAAIACEVLRRDSERQVLGPAVIDYEPLRTAGIVNLPREGVFFDILASLLYVDRRGAPENRQIGFDTVDKVVQMKAIADTASNCGDRSWITEVNWPLWEGPHSPAGRNVSVDAETQADYLVRYYLLALGTGLVERVYWWQLIARGYGLAYDTDENELRRRPAFAAFSSLQRNLDGCLFVAPMSASPSVRLYEFRDRDGLDLVVAWSADNVTRELDLPRPAVRAQERDGREVRPGHSARVQIDGSPRYFWLSPE